MKDLKIRITEVKPITTKDGKKFTAYKALTKDGRIIDAKFRQECENVPTEPCIIIVSSDKCNVSVNRQYPVLWVQEVKAVEEYVKESNSENYFD